MLDGKPYSVHMHDIAGPDEKTSLDETTGLSEETDALIRDADGIVYFYSVTSKLSFEWIRTIHGKIKKINSASTSSDLDTARMPASSPWPVSIVLVGIECEGEKREVSSEEGHKLGQDLGCVVFEASVETKVNVDEALYDIIRKCREARRVQGGNVKTSGWNLMSCLGRRKQ
jgi:hypothetical protein